MKHLDVLLVDYPTVARRQLTQIALDGGKRIVEAYLRLRFHVIDCRERCDRISACYSLSKCRRKRYSESRTKCIKGDMCARELNLYCPPYDTFLRLAHSQECKFPSNKALSPTTPLSPMQNVRMCSWRCRQRAPINARASP